MSKLSVDGVSKKNNTHGVSEISKANSVVDIVNEEVTRVGYSIIKNVFSKKDCSLAKKKIDNIYRRQIKECGSEKFLYSINDQDVARALFLYDDFFLKFINNKSINKCLKRVFGNKYILNLQNAPINRPHNSHYGSTWHRDLSYQHFVPSRPISITTIVCLNKFTKKNGGTCILPFSHKFEKFTSNKFVKKNEHFIEADEGDVLFFDSLLFHRAGANNTAKERKLIVQLFTLPFIKQQIDYSKVLNGKYSKNKDFSYVLGYDTSVEDSVLNWRKRRKARFSKKV